MHVGYYDLVLMENNKYVVNYEANKSFKYFFGIRCLKKDINNQYILNLEQEKRPFKGPNGVQIKSVSCVQYNTLETENKVYLSGTSTRGDDPNNLIRLSEIRNIERFIADLYYTDNQLAKKYEGYRESSYPFSITILIPFKVCRSLTFASTERSSKRYLFLFNEETELNIQKLFN